MRYRLRYVFKSYEVFSNHRRASRESASLQVVHVILHSCKKGGASPIVAVLGEDRYDGLAFDKHFAILVRADRFERDNAPLLTNFRNGAGCGDRVADKNGSDEFHRLREVDDLSLFEFGSENGRDKRTAQHTVGDAATKTRCFSKLFIEMDRVIVARDLGKFANDLIGNLTRGRKAVSDLYVHI